MAEILFRGKRKDDGEWVVGDLVHSVYKIGDTCVGTYGTEIGMHQVDPATVGQFTGLTDKNGTKIFEGDIIRLDFEDSIGVIKFGDYASPMGSDGFTHHIGFYPKFSGKKNKMLRKDIGFYVYAFSDMEVIGNIFDNPELMGGDEDG